MSTSAPPPSDASAAPPAVDPPRKSRTGCILLVVCLGLLVLLCAGPLTWWFGRQAVATRKLDTKIAELRQQQLPVDDESLEVYREQMMDKDKSDAWVQILEVVESTEFNNPLKHLPVLGVPQNEQPFVPGEPWRHAADVEAFLAQHESLLQDIHDVTEQTGAIWTYTEFDSFATLLPYIQATRGVSRILTLEHIDAVRRGDDEQAYRSLLALIGVSRTMEKEPLVISQLVHLATLGVALRQLKMSLELDRLNDDQLRTLLDQLQQLPPIGDRYRWAIQGERAMALPAFDNPGQLDEDMSPIGPLGPRPIDALASLELYAQMETIDTESLDTFIAESRRIEAEFQQQQDEAGLLRRYDTILTSLVVPAMGAVGQAFVRAEMETRIAKTAIGIRLYQHQFDRLPASLDELAELDTDLAPLQPLGTKPFGYRPGEDHALLWGFDLHSASSPYAVPNEPPDLASMDESTREQQQYWLWRLDH
ncbi:hypothetical protein [Roseimaritima sediminicola]|uniref:hypothetical protein n=1 Tax=Roseimaritima sediminicola TaxID=2662066 RepID=UPI00129830B3|nr:hypothetical protein [Roseimaritima sediminicola]